MSASVYTPAGVAVDTTGRVLVTSYNGCKVLEIHGGKPVVVEVRIARTMTTL